MIYSILSRIRISRRWVIFITASSLFVLSQFYRAAVAVITPQLVSDLSLTPEDLSLMSAAFFYAFSLTQVPLAVYLDRIGAVKTMVVLNMIAVCGALVFARSTSSDALIFARVLLGIGMACNLMGTFKLISIWFSPARFATLTAMVFSMGTAGNLIATTPLVLSVQTFGWRFSFMLVAGINLLLTLIFFLAVRGPLQRQPMTSWGPPSSNGLKDAISGIVLLFKTPDYWMISLSTFCRYGIYAAIQTLYAGPYLMFVMGFSALETGNIILCMNVGFICGGPLLGMISDRVLHTRKWIIIPGLIGIAVILLTFCSIPRSTGFYSMAILFLLLGGVNSSGGIMYTHIKERMPAEKSGTAMTGINFFTMIGPAVFLQGLGMFMHGLYPDNAWSPKAFQDVFFLCSICLVSVAVLYLFTKDR